MHYTLYIVTMVTETSLTFLLHDMARTMRQAFDTRARVLGVTRAQWRALLFLAHRDGVTQTELADALEVERITAGRMIDRLVDSGLVERRADPSDRRVWRLHLLPPAFEITRQLSTIGQALEREVITAIPEGKRDEMLDMLLTMRDGLKRLRLKYESEKEVA